MAGQKCDRRGITGQSSKASDDRCGRARKKGWEERKEKTREERQNKKRKAGQERKRRTDR